MADLWPELSGIEEVTPPLKILREQAEALAKKTARRLVGSIVTRIESTRFSHEFYLEVPSMDNYTYHLLTVRHTANGYPLELGVHGLGWVECKDESDFITKLKANFSSKETIEVIQTLLTTPIPDHEEITS